jgi:hypothetical protein
MVFQGSFLILYSFLLLYPTLEEGALLFILFDYQFCR